VIEYLRQIGEAVGPWLYVIAGALAFGEAAIMIGLVLPGETALLVAGFYAHQGVLSLPWMIVIAVVCAIAGDTVGYEIGKRIGPSLRTSRAGNWIGPHRWVKADNFLGRHGGKAVFLGRLTALLRALMPGMAGMSGMRYRTFLAWNAAGGLLWGAGCVLLGYAFGSALSTVERYLTWAPIAVFSMLLLGWIGLKVRERRRNAAEKAALAAKAGERETEAAES
jgi:membrane protein DedA with SNARE-associated domain